MFPLAQLLFIFPLAQAPAPTEPTEPPAQNTTQQTPSEPVEETEDTDQPKEGENAEAKEPGFFSDFFDSGALGLLLDGGPFMWPILLLGVVAIAVIIERYRSLKMLNNDDDKLRNDPWQPFYPMDCVSI
jgi:hypothetical protein